MKNITYFFQFLFTMISFLIFKILGANISSKLSGKLFEIIGPYFRSKEKIHSNIKRAFPEISLNDLQKMTNSMWNNYGRIFAEYIFIKNYRFGNLSSFIDIDGEEILDDIKLTNKQVIFISGHLSNFKTNIFYSFNIYRHNWYIKFFN